jgi:hypothetical protein
MGSQSVRSLRVRGGKIGTILFAAFTQKVPLLRPVLSIALSCWLGFLACVLGCLQPMRAAAPCQGAQASQLDAATAYKSDTEDPCCHHSRNSSRTPKERNTVSCCPLDATLIQKQDPAPPLRSDLYVAVLTLLASNSSNRLSASSGGSAPALWLECRDILLQMHVLRI